MFLSDMGRPRWVMMGIVVKMAQSVSFHPLFLCPLRLNHASSIDRVA